MSPALQAAPTMNAEYINGVIVWQLCIAYDIKKDLFQQPYIIVYRLFVRVWSEISLFHALFEPRHAERALNVAVT